MSDLEEGTLSEKTELCSVSVCVPMYNNADTIARCIESILVQRHRDFELLIVDDGSTDGSVAIASALLRESDRLIVNASRLGLSSNHNKCIALARGDIVQFVHGDDRLHPDALATLLPLFSNPHVGLAFAPRHVDTDDASWLQRYGTLHTNFGTLTKLNSGERLVRHLIGEGARENWIGEPTCVMFRRSAAIRVGGFRDDLYQALDMDLWMKILVDSDAGFHPVGLSTRNHHDGSATKDNDALERQWLDRMRMLSGMAVDSRAPRQVRAISIRWWILVWLDRILYTVVRGPDRTHRLAILCTAPISDFHRSIRRTGVPLSPNKFENNGSHAGRGETWC